MTTVPMYDVEAEEAVLGALLISPIAVETVLGILGASDFGKPSHGAVFEAVSQLHAIGAAVEPGTVYDQLRRDGAQWPTTPNDLVVLQAGAPPASSASRYAEIVLDRSARRRLLAEATKLAKDTADLTIEPAETLEAHQSRLAQIDTMAVRDPGDVDVETFVQQQDEPGITVIKGLLSRDDRAIFVGGEGIGKTELTRQLAVCPAYGLHPFTFQQIEPVRSLLVDLENPRQLVRARLRYLTNVAKANSKVTNEPVRLWSKPGGVDLRRRTDRLALEDILRRHRPQLAVLGPVYKSYTRRSAESDEQVASEVQYILDDLRTRFGFALVLEHHAPQSNGGYREMRPFGSSLWLRWPEFGFKLLADPDRPHVLQVGRWRGDRLQARWPDLLHRGTVWPWEGRWTVPEEGER